jgi:hypothetical protein
MFPFSGNFKADQYKHAACRLVNIRGHKVQHLLKELMVCAY